MFFGISSKDELTQKARAQSEQAPEAYRAIVELYYIARYFVAVFEARNHAIPIQVWNEYRNALDHFMRHLTQSGTPPEAEQGAENPNQLRQMKGHVQRAVLDILKINCHETDKWFQEQLDCDGSAVLALVSNGEFLAQLYELHNPALSLFEQAKAQDSALGAGAQQNKEIVGRFIEAAFAYEALREKYLANQELIAKASNQYASISSVGKKQGFKDAVLANLTASTIWMVVAAAVGAVATYFTLT